MSDNMEAVGAARAGLRPPRIMTLIVGETAPDSGAFFCPMLSHIRGSGGFLNRFKAYGCHLALVMDWKTGKI